MIHNFNTDGFVLLYPKHKGGRPSTRTLPERREIKKIAKSEPAEHYLPFSTRSLTKLADLLVAEGRSYPRTAPVDEFSGPQKGAGSLGQTSLVRPACGWGAGSTDAPPGQYSRRISP